MQYQLSTFLPGVIKIENGIRHFIPQDPNNRDWVAYQAWLAAGNTPLAAEPALSVK